MSSMKLTNDNTVPRTHVRRPFATALAVLALAGSAVLGACDGDNLFSGDTGVIQQGPPLITSINAPSTINEGATLDVRIKAIAPRGMDVVTVRYRRAVNDEVQRSFQGRSDTVTVDVTIAVPNVAADSILVIEAFASDVAGRVSPVVADTVRIIDSSAPSVSATLTPTTASMGDTIVISVSASDRFGLSALGYAIVTAAGDTIRGGPSLFAVSGTQRDTTFTVVLPDSLQPSTLRVIGLAVNNAQLRGVSSPLALTVVDQRPPAITILRPQQNDSHPLSDSLLVRVHVADSGGISSVRMHGEAVRGDSLQNTTIVQRYLAKTIPLPQAGGAVTRDTILLRYLLPTNVGVSETVRIIVQATDMSGNISADTINIIDGPSIAIVNPVSGTSVGLNRSLLVDVRASDRMFGLDSLQLIVGGVVQRTFSVRGLGAREQFDSTFTVNTGNVQGALSLTARVWNRNRISGASQPVNLQVLTGIAADTVAPRVARQVITPTRIELGDSIAVTVRATDGTGSGIVRMGAVMVAIADTSVAGSQQTFYASSQTFSPPLSGTPDRTLYFQLDERFAETLMRFPRQFDLQVHAFAIDEDGNCGASISTDFTALACDTVFSNGVRFYTARNTVADGVEVTVTAGRSIGIPGGGRIADIVVDSVRQRVYLSNIQNNKVEIFHMGVDTFYTTGSSTGRGLVGAAPWGMFINNGGDSLFVANSGGTNVSVMSIDPNRAGYGVEDVSRRILTPEIVLQNVSWKINDKGLTRYSIQPAIGFSDRPQFIAQHSSGTVVFSTRPTSVAPQGTLRYVETDPSSGRPVAKLLTSGSAGGEDVIGLTNVDGVQRQTFEDATDIITIFDRHPVTGAPISASNTDIALAIAEIEALGSDIQSVAGGFANDFLRDTTYVAASGDRSTIAFGEGDTGTSPGRIFLCCASDGTNVSLTSSPIHIEDLVDNAAEAITGLALDWTGTYGVARGRQTAYFFTADGTLTTPLRLQGEFSSGLSGGGGGVAMHPGLSGVLSADQERRLTFVATGNRTIKIIDSVHFYERGEIAIRDNVVGPIRAVFPTAEERNRFTGDDRIVVKLIAVTAGDNVVIIDVRAKDIRQ